MANFKGSSKADTLRGTGGADRIQGLGGNDTLHGESGDDTIEGGNGDDMILPGSGSDRIDGGNGIDTLDYSAWAGSIRVRPTTDYTSNSTTPGSGSVQEFGSDGTLLSTDQFTYVEALIATSGNDLIDMPRGDESVWGGAGDDWISGGDGNDRIYGGAGDDLLDVGNGNDYVDGGDGIDTLSWAYSGLLDPVIDLAAGRIEYPRYGADNWDIVLNVENVRGHYGDKVILGSDGRNIVQGGAGNDVIDGRGGDDILVGDLGRPTATNNYPDGYDDTIRGGAGNDVLSGDVGSDILTGGTGSDTFVIDINHGTDRITDFEDGIDTLALYGGLTITGWEARDTDGDGTADVQAALLSNGEAILFEGLDTPPASLAGQGLLLYSEAFAIAELTNWSMAGGWAGDAFF